MELPLLGADFCCCFVSGGGFLPVSRHSSALSGRGLDGNQAPHADQVIGGDGPPVEPVHAVEAAQFHLAQRPVQFAPTKDPFDQLAFALADRASRIGPLLFRQTILAPVAFPILPAMGGYVARPQSLDKRRLLRLRVGSEGDLLLVALVLGRDGTVQ